MNNYQISALIKLLEEAKDAFPPLEQRGINTIPLQKLERRLDEQVKNLANTPGYRKHLRINALLLKMELEGHISLDTLTELYDTETERLLT